MDVMTHPSSSMQGLLAYSRTYVSYVVYLTFCIRRDTELVPFRRLVHLLKYRKTAVNTVTMSKLGKPTGNWGRYCRSQGPIVRSNVKDKPTTASNAITTGRFENELGETSPEARLAEPRLHLRRPQTFNAKARQAERAPPASSNPYAAQPWQTMARWGAITTTFCAVVGMSIWLMRLWPKPPAFVALAPPVHGAIGPGGLLLAQSIGDNVSIAISTSSNVAGLDNSAFKDLDNIILLIDKLDFLIALRLSYSIKVVEHSGDWSHFSTVHNLLDQAVNYTAEVAVRLQRVQVSRDVLKEAINKVYTSVQDESNAAMDEEIKTGGFKSVLGLFSGPKTAMTGAEKITQQARRDGAIEECEAWLDKLEHTRFTIESEKRRFNMFRTRLEELKTAAWTAMQSQQNKDTPGLDELALSPMDFKTFEERFLQAIKGAECREGGTGAFLQHYKELCHGGKATFCKPEAWLKD